jgi:hypothetical protein
LGLFSWAWAWAWAWAWVVGETNKATSAGTKGSLPIGKMTPPLSLRGTPSFLLFESKDEF